MFFVQAKKVVGARNETKLAVEELNEKVEAARAKGKEDDTANKRALGAKAAQNAKKGASGKQGNRILCLESALPLIRQVLYWS